MIHTFQADIAAFQKDLLDMAEQAPAIMARALNRAGVSGQTVTTRAVTADMGIAGKYAKREIKIDKATRTHPMFVVSIGGYRIPLIAFGARGPEPSRGRLGSRVTAGVKGGRKTYPGAFITRVPNVGPESNWHKGVFVRKPRLKSKSRGAWSKNLPIIQLYGPSVKHVFEKFLPTFFSAAQESLVKNLAHEISFARSKVTGDE